MADKTFYVKLVKPGSSGGDQKIFIVDAKDAFAAVKKINDYTGVTLCERIEAYPYHGKIYYPRKLR